MPIQTNETFRHTIETIARVKSSPVEVFSDFVKMAACALARQTREDEYQSVVARYTEDEKTELGKAFAKLINEMEHKPFSDVLGSYYETINSKSARNNRGEFFTPEPISELMARIVFDVDKAIADNKPITVNEPACGSGGMILQIAKLFSPRYTQMEKSYVDLLRVTAMDLSPAAADMTFVNTSLWGIPAHVIQGNALTQEIDNQWKNIHWHRVGEDQRRAYEEMLQMMTAPQPNVSAPLMSPQIDLGELKQSSFEF